jgi:hypothetical protein
LRSITIAKLNFIDDYNKRLFAATISNGSSRWGESHNTPHPPTRSARVAAGVERGEPAAVAYPGEAIAPEINDLARLQPRRSQLGISLLPWQEWGQETSCIDRPAAIRIFEPRYPSEYPCPTDPVFHSGVFPYSKQQVGIHEAEEFPLCLSGMPLQGNAVNYSGEPIAQGERRGESCDTPYPHEERPRCRR